jgi:hypothetical protein
MFFFLISLLIDKQEKARSDPLFLMYLCALLNDNAGPVLVLVLVLKLIC